MIKKLLGIILIGLQLLSGAVFAQTTANLPGCNGYVIAFGNGIMNSRAQMHASKVRLSEIFGNTYNGQTVTYKTAENPSDGLLADLTDVLEQKIAEDPSIGWEIGFKSLFGTALGIIPLAVYNHLQTLFKTFLAEALPLRTAELRRKYEEQYAYIDAEVSDHVAMFTQLIKTDKRKVMLVAHSQGNLYANASHRGVYLDPEIKTRSFAVVGVASPANFVGGGGPYMTSGNDMVIAALRSLVNSDTLPANIDIPFTFDDVQGHGFLPIYTNEAYPGLARLKEMGVAQLDALEDPDQHEDTDLRAYKWFYAESIREESSGEPPRDTRNASSRPGCFDNYNEECLDYFEHRRDYLKETKVSIYPHVACCENYNDPANAIFGKGGARPGILMPGEPYPMVSDGYGNRVATTEWTIVSSAKAALNSMVLPRVFNPANPAYVGFTSQDAKVRYLERDGYWGYVQWLPLLDPGPATWTIETDTITYAGVKSCKPQ